jgi:hypothetical protein
MHPQKTQTFDLLGCAAGLRSFGVLLCLSVDAFFDGPRAARAGSRQFGTRSDFRLRCQVPLAPQVLMLARHGSPRSSAMLNSFVSLCRCRGPLGRAAPQGDRSPSGRRKHDRRSHTPERLPSPALLVRRRCASLGKHDTTRADCQAVAHFESAEKRRFTPGSHWPGGTGVRANRQDRTAIRHKTQRAAIEDRAAAFGSKRAIGPGIACQAMTAW